MEAALKKQKQKTVQIISMTCAACANRIEKGLNKMEGVDSANVNFALERATVTYDSDKVNDEAIEATIKKLGYGTVKEVTRFKLEGMTCAACANRIEKGLNKMPGVTNASVNFALETATVEYSPAEVSVADMQSKVKQLGYKAVAQSDEEEHADTRDRAVRKQKRKLIVSAILSIPLLWAMVAHFSFTSWIYLPDLFMNPWFQLVLATPQTVLHRMAVLRRGV